MNDDILGGLGRQEVGRGTHHPVGEITARTFLRGLGENGGVGPRGLAFGVGQEALLVHQLDDGVGAVLAALEVVGRRVIGRRGQEPGEHRRLRRVHIGGGDAEIALGGGLEAARARPEIGAVEVDRQDVVLGIFELHRQRIGHFLDLALHPAGAAVVLVIGLGLPALGIVFDAKAEELGHLLREGRAAIARERTAPGGEIDAHRRGDAARAYAEMAVEALVLGGDDGVFQVG